MNKTELIKARLIDAGFIVFSCTNVSEEHAGHAGASLESHFNVVLKKNFSTPHGRLAAHQQVLSLFSKDIPADIHALSITFIAQ